MCTHIKWRDRKAILCKLRDECFRASMLSCGISNSDNYFVVCNKDGMICSLFILVIITVATVVSLTEKTIYF